MVDRDVVGRRLSALQLYLTDVGDYVAIERDAYLADRKTQHATERALLLAIEVCIDLGEHVIADRRLAIPETTAGVFTTLATARLLPPALAGRLAAMSRFRNLLVHDYAQVDAGRVFDIARTDVHDLEGFAETIKELIA